MAYPALGVNELSTFSGRPVASYPPSYPDQAIRQSVLIFKIATGLTDDLFPQPGTWQYDLAVMAILSEADDIILEQPFQAVRASPFNSESIGSYSYSKVGGKSLARAVSTIASDGKTGNIWFDLAVEQLGIVINAVDMPAYGGIEIFEHNEMMVRGNNPHNMRLLGPSDIRLMRYYGLDPAGNFNYSAQATFSPAVNEGEEPWVEDPPGSGLFVPPWEYSG